MSVRYKPVKFKDGKNIITKLTQHRDFVYGFIYTLEFFKLIKLFEFILSRLIFDINLLQFTMPFAQGTVSMIHSSSV